MQLPNTSCAQRMSQGSGVMISSQSISALIVALARAEHHPVLAERDGLAVAVGGDVADGQD